MSDPWRNRGFTANTFSGYPKDDGFLNANETWWRITGIGGDRILTAYIGLQHGDIEECITIDTICGPDANCTNTIGDYYCICNEGYRVDNPAVIASVQNPCKDIDECAETPGLCGPHSLCTNVPGTFHCSCLDGYYPTTGVLWEMGISVCQSVPEILNSIVPPEGQTKEMTFLKKTNQQLQNNSDHFVPEGMVTNSIYAALEVSGVGNNKSGDQVSVDGDGETGSMVLQISERLVSAMVKQTQNNTNITIQTNTMEISVQAIGPKGNSGSSTPLSAMGNTMEINLQSLAKNNNGTATAVFMSVSGMGDLLSHKYYQSENYTEMYSDVLTAILPKTNNTKLSEPVNFTIYHKKRLPDSAFVTCVYWEDVSEKEGDKGQQQGEAMRWSVTGCWIAFSDENHTLCSCSHLSTFALILQIGEPPAEDPFLEWVNRVLVCIGLVFFALAILTFLLCSWNPKINNTARLHLCICLSLTHLLLLFNAYYVGRKFVCSVMAGLLHFLVVGSFVWMLLEALQLHLLVRRLSKVQVIQRDGLPRPLLYLIGYGIPVVIVGVSAWRKPDGYGGTKMCWLTTKDHFVWALTGPVIAILAMNWILFGATLWSLRPTLVNMKSGVSQSTDTRIIVFKILAQFVILGCTWILGLYQSNKFFQYLFVLLNSQQGTFLYIVHCLFNKEVQRFHQHRFLIMAYIEQLGISVSITSSYHPSQSATGFTPFHIALCYMSPLVLWTPSQTEVPAVDESFGGGQEFDPCLSPACCPSAETTGRPANQLGDRVWLLTWDLKKELNIP
ncbi:adhesion G protein-coupled receptor E5-like [Aplochiton taeniatus]